MIDEFANIRTTLRPGSGTLHCKVLSTCVDILLCEQLKIMVNEF